MHFREYIENVIISRLLDKSRDVRKISDQEFNDFLIKLKPNIESFATGRKINGFTSEDLYSFLILKLHQVLRRGQYNPDRSDYRFFNTIFDNFLNDINRMKDRCLGRGYDLDPLDDCVSFDDRWRNDV